MVKIAVASGKGGTGKTFVSTNIFYTLLTSNFRAMLVDCDAEAPNAIAFFKTELKDSSEVTQMVPVINRDACTWCSKCHEYCSYNAIFILPPMKIIEVIEDLCHGCGACIAACNYGAISEKPVSLGRVNEYTTEEIHPLLEASINVGVMSPVPLIKAAIKKINCRADIVILDSPPGTSCPFIQTVSEADYVILVTEPTPFGLSDLRQSVETLSKIEKRCGVIINRSGLGNDDVKKYLLAEGIQLLLEIPFDRKIAEMCSTGKLVSESDALFAKQLLELTENIIRSYGNSSN